MSLPGGKQQAGAEQILSGYSAYVGGSIVTGTMEISDSAYNVIKITFAKENDSTEPELTGECIYVIPGETISILKDYGVSGKSKWKIRDTLTGSDLFTVKYYGNAYNSKNSDSFTAPDHDVYAVCGS